MSYEKVLQAQSMRIGTKQTAKALRTGKAKSVVIALDADARLTVQVVDTAKEFSVPIHYVDSMQMLGKACRIDVGAATVAIME